MSVELRGVRGFLIGVAFTRKTKLTPRACFIYLGFWLLLMMSTEAKG